MKFIPLSIKIVVLSGFLTTLFFVIFCFLQYRDLEKNELQLLSERMERQADMLSKTLAQPIWDYNTDQIHSMAKIAQGHPDISAITILDASNAVIEAQQSEKGRDEYTIEKNILYKKQQTEEKIATLRLTSIRDNTHARVTQQTHSIVYTGAVLVLVQLVLLYLILHQVLGPLESITHTMESISDGDIKLRVPVMNSHDEITVLAQTFNKMLSRIEAREKELSETSEKAEAANRAKTEFLANMSHEIRTPINGIMGFAQLLERSELNEKQKKFIDIILSSSHALLAIINDILDISKIEAGKMEIQATTFRLQQILQEVTQVLMVAAENKGLVLKLEMDDAIPPSLAGDAMRIRQILLNFAGNAVKFTEEGQVTIRAHMLEKSETHAVINIEVEDTGIGVPAHAQEKLFEKFVQADNSNTRKYEGTGLGLAISKQLALLMGGTVGMKNAPKQGAVFWVTLPLPLFATTPNEEDVFYIS